MIYVFLFTLFLPIYTMEAGGEFGAVCFVVCYTLTALSVTRTGFFRAGTVYGVMWAMGHGGSGLVRLQIPNLTIVTNLAGVFDKFNGWHFAL